MIDLEARNDELKRQNNLLKEYLTKIEAELAGDAFNQFINRMGGDNESSIKLRSNKDFVEALNRNRLLYSRKILERNR